MVAVGFVSVYRGRDSARTARCAVLAAFSGASTWPGQRVARSVPPAARGRGRRSAASLPANYVRTVNRYETVGYFRSSLRDFCEGVGLSPEKHPKMDRRVPRADCKVISLPCGKHAVEPLEHALFAEHFEQMIEAGARRLAG